VCLARASTNEKTLTKQHKWGRRRKKCKLQTKWSTERPTTRTSRKKRWCLYKYTCLQLRQEENEQKKKKKAKESCTYTTAIARVRRNDRRVFSSMLFAVVLFYRRERSEVRLLPTPSFFFFFFFSNKYIQLLVLWDEKPSRKKRRKGKKKKKKKKSKSYYILSWRVFLLMFTRVFFLLSPCLFLSFCVVNGKTTREFARLRQFSYDYPSAHIDNQLVNIQIHMSLNISYQFSFVFPNKKRMFISFSNERQDNYYDFIHWVDKYTSTY